jgi:hypothetical protein
LNNFIKIAIRNAILFAIYQLILIIVFDVISFFSNSINSLNFYSLVFFTVFGIHFLIHSIVDTIKAEIGIKRIVNSTSFIFTAVIASTTIWWIFEGGNSIVIYLISSFVIPSLFPAIGYFLISLFKENLAEVEVVNSVSNSISSSTVINAVENFHQPIKEKQKDEIQFVLENENGKELLNVPVKSILCFEANDNYVVTYFIDKQDKLKKSMERVSLKKIEEIILKLNINNFSRVHKSYLINRDEVEEIRGKAQAHKVKLNNLEILVPVSRSFQISLLK